MSIEQQPGKKPLASTPPPIWGEVAPEGHAAAVVRFALTDRVICYPVAELRRWEHVAGEPETLSVNAGKELIVVEGRELNAVRAALDLGRLCEVRPTPERANVRPGPRVRRITVEPA